MPEQDAQDLEASHERLANRAKEIQQVEERLVRDLKTCIDTTNKLLERISKVAGGQTDGAQGESSLEPG